MKSISRNVFLILLLLTAFSVLFANRNVPLSTVDGQRCLTIAEGMIRTGDYLSPVLGNEILLGVPPLCYWFIAGAIQIFGSGDLAVRFPAAVMSLLTVILTYVSATKIWNERIGFWAGMILSSNLLFFHVSRISVTDTTFIFFFTGILLCFMQGCYWLMYVLCGFALLAVGIIGLLIPMTVILLYLFFVDRISRLGEMHIIPGIIITIGICFPWYLMMIELHGTDFLSAVFRYNVLLESGASKALNGWWLHILILLAGMFPWTGLLVKSMKDGICESRSTDLKSNIFLQLWFLISVLFFVFLQVSKATMLLMVFPAFSMLVSWNMERMIREDKGHFTGWAWETVSVYFIVSSILIVGGQNFPEITFGTTILGILLILFGGGVGAALLIYKDGILAAFLQAGTGYAMMIILYYFLLPVALPHYSFSEIVKLFF